MFTSLLSGLPFSFTAHAKDIYTSDPRQLREKLGLAQFVITCTAYNRRHLSQLYAGAPDSIFHIYHGIDTGLFSFDEATHPVPAKPYQILTIARFTAKKGLPTVYRALKELHARGVPFEHILIGDGEDRHKILALINDLGLNTHTRWLGTQPHDVVLAHYKQAHLFVLGCEVAANGDRDGIPNVLLESMAMGVPVVATAVSAIPELVETEKTGLLVQPGQPKQLAEAMIKLLTDTELRTRVISAARKRVLQDFDNKLLIREIADIYRNKIQAFKNLGIKK
jgi:glycosyltransferase involved in cell wall biosynthesis